jgi:hypothetical protein
MTTGASLLVVVSLLVEVEELESVVVVVEGVGEGVVVVVVVTGRVEVVIIDVVLGMDEVDEVDEEDGRVVVVDAGKQSWLGLNSEGSVHSKPPKRKKRPLILTRKRQK